MNSKRKGKDGELALMHKLKEYGYDVRRSQQYAGINGDADIVGIDGYHIECKYCDKGHGLTYEWMEQAKRDKKDNEVPVVIHKRISTKHRGLPWLITMELEDFLKLRTNSDKY